MTVAAGADIHRFAAHRAMSVQSKAQALLRPKIPARPRNNDQEQQHV
jgi:hypothetical protein